MDRRKFLLTGASATTLAVAGCADGDESGPTDDGGESTDDGDESTGGDDQGGNDEQEQTDNQEEGDAVFEFTDISPGDESVEQGESIDVTATVENTGTREGTGEINFELGDDNLDLDDPLTSSFEVTLEPGGEANPGRLVDTGQLDAGPYGYTFTSEDDEISSILTVTQPTITEPDPYSFSGTGQSVESGIEIEGGLTVVEATHDGDLSFVVSLVGGPGRENEFISWIGGFDGARADSIDSGEYRLEVDADGSWEVEVRQPRSATGDSLPVSLSGTAPDVIGPIQFEGEHVVAGTHGETGPFIVRVYRMNGLSRLIFNEAVGEFDGETTVTLDDVGWVDVNADGNWTVDIE